MRPRTNPRRWLVTGISSGLGRALAAQESMAADFLKQIPVEDYPDLVEHIHQHIEPHDEETSGFELGLDLILDGLDRARASA